MFSYCFRHELDAAIFHRLDGGLASTGGHARTTGRSAWFDGHAATVAVRLLQHVIL